MSYQNNKNSKSEYIKPYIDSKIIEQVMFETNGKYSSLIEKALKKYFEESSKKRNGTYSFSDVFEVNGYVEYYVCVVVKGDIVDFQYKHV